VKCPKCGSRNITTKYDATVDRLRRSCVHCGYWWTELPNDIKAKFEMELENGRED